MQGFGPEWAPSRSLRPATLLCTQHGSLCSVPRLGVTIGWWRVDPSSWVYGRREGEAIPSPGDGNPSFPGTPRLHNEQSMWESWGSEAVGSGSDKGGGQATACNDWRGSTGPVKRGQMRLDSPQGLGRGFSCRALQSTGGGVSPQRGEPGHSGGPSTLSFPDQL